MRIIVLFLCGFLISSTLYAPPTKHVKSGQAQEEQTERKVITHKTKNKKTHIKLQKLKKKQHKKTLTQKKLK